MSIGLSACTAQPPEQQSTPSVERQEASSQDGTDSSVEGFSVSFPDRDDLRASVVEVAADTEMKDALPDDFQVSEVVDLELKDSRFPDTGGDIVFDLDEPAPMAETAIVAH